MFIWWQRIRNTNWQPLNLTNVSNRQSHTSKRHHRQSTNSQHQPYSVHNCANQSKCVRTTITDQSSRMNSFCSVIILIHCFNVLVLAIASENFINTQAQPCDRSRRVFTDIQGEISNGPPGYNYTQVSFSLFCAIPWFHFVVFGFHLSDLILHLISSATNARTHIQTTKCEPIRSYKSNKSTANRSLSFFIIIASATFVRSVLDDCFILFNTIFVASNCELYTHFNCHLNAWE